MQTCKTYHLCKKKVTDPILVFELEDEQEPEVKAVTYASGQVKTKFG